MGGAGAGAGVGAGAGAGVGWGLGGCWVGFQHMRDKREKR